MADRDMATIAAVANLLRQLPSAVDQSFTINQVTASDPEGTKTVCVVGSWPTQLKGELEKVQVCRAIIPRSIHPFAWIHQINTLALYGCGLRAQIELPPNIKLFSLSMAELRTNLTIVVDPTSIDLKIEIKESNLPENFANPEEVCLTISQGKKESLIKSTTTVTFDLCVICKLDIVAAHVFFEKCYFKNSLDLTDLNVSDSVVVNTAGCLEHVIHSGSDQRQTRLQELAIIDVPGDVQFNLTRAPIDSIVLRNCGVATTPSVWWPAGCQVTGLPTTNQEYFTEDDDGEM